MASRKASKSVEGFQVPVKVESSTEMVKSFVSNLTDGLYSMGRYQRGDVYTPAQRNSLIASIFLRIPIGEITLMRTSGGGFEVLDGGHRLRTLAAFYRNEFRFKAPADACALRPLNGKLYRELTKPEQRAFSTATVAKVILTPEVSLSAEDSRKFMLTVMDRKLSAAVPAAASNVKLIKQAVKDDACGRVLENLRDEVNGVVMNAYASHGLEFPEDARRELELAIVSYPELLITELSKNGLLSSYSRDSLLEAVRWYQKSLVDDCGVRNLSAQISLCVGYACAGVRGRIQEFAGYVRREYETRTEGQKAPRLCWRDYATAIVCVTYTSYELDGIRNELREHLSGDGGRADKVKAWASRRGYAYVYVLEKMAERGEVVAVSATGYASRSKRLVLRDSLAGGVL